MVHFLRTAHVTLDLEASGLEFGGGEEGVTILALQSSTEPVPITIGGLSGLLHVGPVEYLMQHGDYGVKTRLSVTPGPGGDLTLAALLIALGVAKRGAPPEPVDQVRADVVHEMAHQLGLPPEHPDVQQAASIELGTR